MTECDVKVCRLKPHHVKTVLEMTDREGWNVSEHDIVFFQRFQPEGFLAAEIDGECVGCVIAVLHGDKYGSVGAFIVNKERRGKGIGRALLSAALERLEVSKGVRNVWLSSRPSMVPTYIKYGFTVTSWEVVDYSGKICLPKPQIPSDSQLKLVPIHEVSIEDLSEYDFTLLSIYDRKDYWSLKLQRPNMVGFAALEDGRIVGFCMKHTKTDGHCVAPLYADSLDIAQLLLQYTLADVVEGEVVAFETLGANPRMTALATWCGLTEDVRLQRLYTKEVIPLPVEKVYALSDSDVSFI